MTEQKQEKRVYDGPQLIVHGDIETLTMGGPQMINGDVPSGPTACAEPVCS
jgi:hypothetical protein